ncbi:MAG: MBL fold metallo-hydrolase [Anaerolineae bacterium]|nr:MBL fold metallo-hydrolase [Anaerolineae bacterium]MDW8071303.1 ComEC/Rec2 family competence protein [Anaerolineae bacterium]
MRIRRRQLQWSAASSLVVLVVLLAWLLLSTPVAPPPSPATTPTESTLTTASRPLLTVAFLDVGQGDATLIRSPGGHTMLIDGSNSRDDAERVILPTLKSWKATRLNLLVITHPDQDHIGGLPHVLEALPVDRVALTGQVHTTQTYERVLTLIRDKKIPAIKVRRGMQLELDPQLTLAVLGPDDAAVEQDDTNNASIVIRLTYERVAMLFTGDAEEPAEEAILRSGADVRAQILKVAHHGSASGSSPEWLRAVAPEVAIISVGAENAFGHPSQAVLSRLIQANVVIYRTDRHGSITIRSDGDTYQVFTER